MRTTISIPDDLKRRIDSVKPKGVTYAAFISYLLDCCAEEPPSTPEAGGWSPTFTARVESKSRIWLPRVIRESLGLVEGDVVEVRVRKVSGGLLRR